MTSDIPGPEETPVEAGLVMAVFLGCVGLPMTAVAGAFAFGNIEDIGKGVLVAVAAWAIGIGLAFVVPLRTGPADPVDAAPTPVQRWALPAVVITALVVVVASGEPFLPWVLVLVGATFAWVAGSIWILTRGKSRTTS